MTWTPLTPGRYRCALVLAITLAGAGAQAPTARAQTVLDPKTIEFLPVPEHHVTLPDGKAALLSYALYFFVASTHAQFAVVNIGRPPVRPDGMIRYNFSSQLTNWPHPNTECVIRVGAIGPGGEALSLPSNTFVVRANAPPTVQLTSPADGMVFDTRATVRFAVNAADTDGVIAKVDFYVGTARIGTTSTAPYQISTRLKTPGAYRIWAIATDNRGAETTSNAVSVQVRRKAGL